MAKFPKPAPKLPPHYKDSWIDCLLGDGISQDDADGKGPQSAVGYGSWPLPNGPGPLGYGSWPLPNGSSTLGYGSGPLTNGPDDPDYGSWPLPNGSGALGYGSWPLPNGLGRKSGLIPHLGRGTGYHADLPDHRDYCHQHLAALVQQGTHKNLKKSLPHFLGGNNPATDSKLDSRGRKMPHRAHLGDENLFLWPVEDQGPFQSCTAHAVIGMVEYLLRKAQEKRQRKEQRIDLSRLFLYKATRDLLGWRGDTGAFLRKTIQAMALFGAPPERFWPYAGTLLNASPSSFCYSYAQQYKALDYVRLDEYQAVGDQTINQVRRVLADKFPVAFGFPVYQSIALIDPDMHIIPPADAFPNDRMIGGHAVLAVGYDDTVQFPLPMKKGQSETGALIIRNSWGTGWGDRGFAYLPYSYVKSGLACDFWSIFSQGNFKEGAFED